MTNKSFHLKSLVRPNIWNLEPYRCARDDYNQGILLDANEHAFGSALPQTTNHNLARYPDPHQISLKSQFASWRLGFKEAANKVFVGVGSDEVLDLVMRVFGTPQHDKILICPPTYGMYSISAAINDLAVVSVPLLSADLMFQLDVPLILDTLQSDPLIKLVFLCSPGNPTGSYLNIADIQAILDVFLNGIVVVDEAYIDFVEGYDLNGAAKQSCAHLLDQYPNLLVSQTFSKSFGLAGARLGVALSSPEIIQLLNKTKSPYNVSTPSSLLGTSALSRHGLHIFNQHLDALKRQRTYMIIELGRLPFAGRVLGLNDANFVLIEVLNHESRVPCNKAAFTLYKALADGYNIVVRFRGMEPGCTGCLRVTVGTMHENNQLLACWRKYYAAIVS